MRGVCVYSNPKQWHLKMHKRKMNMGDAWEQRILANCPAFPIVGARERERETVRLHEGRHFSFLIAFSSC